MVRGNEGTIGSKKISTLSLIISSKLLNMAEWKQKISEFLNKQGIKKNIAEFTEFEEQQIQGFIDETLKLAFSALEEELNTYSGLKANIMTSKSKSDSIRENIEFNIIRVKIIFSYRPFFFKSEDVIRMRGQYCIPNLYGDKASYSFSSLDNPIDIIAKDAIIEDFSECFQGNVNLEDRKSKNKHK